MPGDIVTSTNIFYERREGGPIPMTQSIRASAEAGYRLLDFGFVELFFSTKPGEGFRGPAWRAELEGYLALAGKLGLSFVQGHATLYDFCSPTANHTEGREMFLRSIEGAALLGIPWLVAHPSTGVKDGALAPGTHAQNVAFFTEMADIAAGYNVGIAVENMWGLAAPGVPRYALRAEELLRLVEDVNRENLGACWDVEHGGVEKLDQPAALRLLGRHLKATHISDETGPDNIHILPYTGFINWESILRTLAEIGYEGPFAFEIQHYLPGVPLPLVPAALRFSLGVGRHMVAALEGYKAERRVDG